MTTHNPSTPLTVSDILLKNGTARLEDFYPLTKVKTASDKENNGSFGQSSKGNYPKLIIMRAVIIKNNLI